MQDLKPAFNVIISGEKLAFGKFDYHCKIKETLFTQDLKSAFNVNISSEKLMLNLISRPLVNFVKIVSS